MPSPPLQRIWEPSETAVLFLWRFVFHLIRLRSVRVSKRCLRSNPKFKPCFYVSFIFFFFEDLFSLMLWKTNSAVNYIRLDLVVQWAKFYRIRQAMVRIFLVAFYLHKFIASVFCAWLEQWGLTVSTVSSRRTVYPFSTLPLLPSSQFQMKDKFLKNSVISTDCLFFTGIQHQWFIYFGGFFQLWKIKIDSRFNVITFHCLEIMQVWSIPC